MWQQMKEQKEALLIGYLIAGDPTESKSLKIVENALLAGLDILELGIPSLNPYLDGPIIQEGHARVDPNRHDWLVPFCRKVRKQVQKPIWAMGYKADIFRSNLYERLVSERLIDTLLVPDCSATENYQIALEVKNFGVDVVQFIQPTMSDKEIADITRYASIIYAQTYVGTTGSSTILGDLPTFYKRIRNHTEALIVAGFGLKTPENVRTVIESKFDGAVVGSALVDCCKEEKHDKLFELISEMKKKTDLYEVKG